MNSVYHAKSSAKKWGGHWEEYLPIHEFIDSSKAAVPDMRHRAMLHNSWGIFLTERVFGPVWSITTISGVIKDIPTRLIAEEHIMQDLGFIPTLSDWLTNMTLYPWMSGTKKSKTMTRSEFTGGANGHNVPG